jgi:hypothetical protein
VAKRGEASDLFADKAVGVGRAERARSFNLSIHVVVDVDPGGTLAADKLVKAKVKSA